MGILINLLKRVTKDKEEFSEDFKKAQREDKVRQMVEERKKSSNERALEDFYKRKREEDIKRRLDKIREGQTKESWKSENQFFGQRATILKQDFSILKSNNSLKSNRNKSKNLFFS